MNTHHLYAARVHVYYVREVHRQPLLTPAMIFHAPSDLPKRLQGLGF